MITRRSILTGLLAAPIVVRTGLIMPVKALAESDGAMLTSMPHPVDLEAYRKVLNEMMAKVLNRMINPPLVVWNGVVDWPASKQLAEHDAASMRDIRDRMRALDKLEHVAHP